MQKEEGPILFQKISSTPSESKKIIIELYEKFLSQTQNLFLLLQGNLGTGKTFSIRSLAEHLGIPQTVNSPTFNLLNSYYYKHIELHHYDLYRLKSLTEFENLDFQERWYKLPENNKKIIHAIEWPELLSEDMFSKEGLVFTLRIEYDFVKDMTSPSRIFNLYSNRL